MRRKLSYKSIFIILLNIVVGVALFVIFLFYSRDYRAQLQKQNLNDIVNLNQSAANIASTYFDNQQRALTDMKQYEETEQMTEEQFLSYMVKSSTQKNYSYQLINEKDTGYVIGAGENTWEEVTYTHVDYKNLKKIFENARVSGQVSFTPEFTDNYSGCQSVALYTYVTLLNEDGSMKNETLLAVSKSNDVQKYINLDGGFDGMETILTDESCNYILSTPGFKATNLTNYLAVFNNLTLDQEKVIQSQITQAKKGVLYYKNYLGNESVFVYTEVPETLWYCVSSVPLSSFHSSNMEYTHTLLICLLLFILMIVDVSWLYRINVRLKESVAKAKIASQAKTDFLSRMSHDIRTPLNVINGMTILALQEPNSPQTEEYLTNISSSNKFLTGLVNDILDLNKVESGMMELHPSPYTFEEFKRYVEAVIEPLFADKNIMFQMENHVEEIALNIDSLRFNQIFFNLLSNASKFTKENGHVTLECEAHTTDSSHMILNYVVRDDGVGMTEEFQKHMFDAFSQENPTMTGNIHGTGLGLSIVKQLVTLMEGEIRVESAPGKGTAFYITLPCEKAEHYVEQKEISYSEEKLHGKHVLLCEDHPLNSKIAQKLLEKKDMVVETAFDGAIGVQKFQESSIGYYDIVLMDIKMPNMDGFEATRRIRAIERADAKTIPIIAMTANAYDVDVQNSLDAGMNSHIPKPVDPQILYRTLAKYL